MATNDLLVLQTGSSLYLTLNREKAGNAYSEEMVEALIEQIQNANSSDTIKTIVITGTGKIFCAGGDIERMVSQKGMFAGNTVELAQHYQRWIQKLTLALLDCQKITVAAINGPAIGAGLGLASFCDLRIASERAKFSYSFIKLGLIPGDGSLRRLEQLIGKSRASYLTITGEEMDAMKALAYGFTQETCLHELLLPRVEKLVEQFNIYSLESIQALKEVLRLSSENGAMEDYLKSISSLQGKLQRDPHHLSWAKKILERMRSKN
jgi:enoyl-CoA hydratase/carnithine racemase